MFDFKELPLWDAASADKPAWDLSFIEVYLSITEPKATDTTPIPPPFSDIETPHDISAAFNLHLQGALKWLQWTSLTTSAPISQHSMPGRKAPSATLGAPLSSRADDPLGLEGMDSAIPDPMATSSQAYPHVAKPESIPSIIQVSHSPSLPTMMKTPKAASISPTPQSQAPPRANPADLSNEVLWLQGGMNVALEQLLMTKATMDSCQRELALSTDITTWHNEAQAAKAIKEADVHCALQSRRQRPVVLFTSALCNNVTRKAC